MKHTPREADPWAILVARYPRPDDGTCTAVRGRDRKSCPNPVTQFDRCRYHQGERWEELLAITAEVRWRRDNECPQCGGVFADRGWREADSGRPVVFCAACDLVKVQRREGES